MIIFGLVKGTSTVGAILFGGDIEGPFADISPPSSAFLAQSKYCRREHKTEPGHSWATTNLAP